MSFRLYAFILLYLTLIGFAIAQPSLSRDSVNSYPVEKIHIHFDKSSYSTGDIIWLKSYIVDQTGKLSGLSKILYVDLIDPKGKINSTLKLPVAGGMANGDIRLSDSLETGTYRVRAYTRWMQNYDHRFFFNKFINVSGRDAIRKTSEKNLTESNFEIIAKTSSPAFNESSAVNFYPETGKLLNNIPGKVVVKITDTQGTGIKVKGYVVDTKSTRAAEFETGYDGLGDFVITPFPGEIYTARIKAEDGNERSYALPLPSTEGYSLKVTGIGSPKLNVRVYNSTNSNSPALLMLQSAKGDFQVAEIPNNKTFVDIILRKTQIPSGIVKFTLEDVNQHKLAERLVFVEAESPEVILARPATVNDSIGILVKNHDGKKMRSAWSASIVKGIQEIPDEGDIAANLSLKSELINDIESPQYYFTEPSASRWQQLDNLMITQTWRFDGDKALPEAIHKPESGLEISGKVLKSDKPLADADLTLMGMKGGILMEAKTDKAGRFIFQNLVFTGNEKFVVQAKEEKNRANSKIIFDTRLIPPVSPSTGSNELITLPESSQSIAGNADKKSVSDLQSLEEVKVTAKKITKPERSSKLGTQAADYVIPQDAFNGVQYLDDALRGRIPGINFFTAPSGEVYAYLMRNRPRVSTAMPTFMRVYMDGMPMSAGTDLRSIALHDIDNIEVVVRSGTSALYGPNAAGGMLLINSKTGSVKGNDQSNSTSTNGTIDLEGYSIAKEFNYKDKEAGMNNKNEPPETVYWNPKLFTSEKGVIKLDFIPDPMFEYSLVLEGIDELGTPLRRVFRLKDL